MSMKSSSLQEMFGKAYRQDTSLAKSDSCFIPLKCVIIGHAGSGAGALLV